MTITYADPVPAAGQELSWSSTVPISKVWVKGGDGGLLYEYSPAAMSGSGLHAPLAPSGKWADVSHITFYYCFVPGHLQVTKSVNMGGVVGSPTVPDFVITVTGPSYPSGDSKTFNETNGWVQTWSNLIPGAYTVVETDPGTPWTVTGSGQEVTVVGGQTALATVTNTYVPGALTVNKVVVAPTGTIVPDFLITVTGPSYPAGNTVSFNSGNSYTYTWNGLIPGDYLVAEADPGAEWAVTVPAAAIAVVSGQTATATVTNTYIVECEPQTAWAYGGPKAVPFTGLGFSNWGWTNGPYTEGTHVLDLWAGAGGNDLSKGTLVGTVTVVYSGGYVTVTYNTPGYTMTEAHLYIGSTPLPQVVQGKKTIMTSSPGQFPYADGTEGASYTFGPYAMTGPIYVAAHAVVCVPVTTVTTMMSAQVNGQSVGLELALEKVTGNPGKAAQVIQAIINRR